MTALQLNAELYRAMDENRETEVSAASVFSSESLSYPPV